MDHGRLDAMAERFLVVRFLEEPGESFSGEAGGDFVLGVAAGQDDADVGIESAQFSKSFFPVHMGHGQVEEDEGDGVLRVFVGFDGLGSVGGGENG